MRHPQLSLRKRCEAILGRLELTHPFSLDGLCGRIAEERGRPIRLHPLPKEAAESGVCGLWVGTASIDYVFYEAQTTPLHREHIVLHEIGHILFGHNSLEVEDAAGTAEDAGQVPTVLGRTNYTTRQEQEAEMLASMIRTRTTTPGAHRAHGAGDRDTLARLESAMGYERRGRGLGRRGF
ncbi:ImmA/IrrE family metallo-endopeptidase [Streptomyces sp. ISL-43]|uniref:ImmA/IrrE family metallo-endopeptidase n=1 Tax=Streptomyces sp. ISL-43 TaxID=2819183 RepID=UPI001BE7212D|nr:ImmA/IrrE family metallo-endopeptidase [Streptomyces sp. ISL-43]MBT2448922.1 ImmA/IrrE family metallo-endopeptidase [Streptomyces sp. ISL-43]